MKAITQHRYGAPTDVLQLEEVDKPVVPDKGVLIRVRAAAICKGDWHLTTGTPYLVRLVFGLRRPKNPLAGQEMAGTVEAVGPGVTGFKPGDSVFGELHGGAFVEYASATEDQIVPMPANASFEQAATVPSAVTALKGLRDCAKLQSGQHVLINGAAGGVGTFAVQIAKSFGATVTAVCSAGKADMVRSIGADHIIDYESVDFAAGDQRYDVVFDLVGNRPLRDYRRVLTRTGTYVASAGGNGKWIAPMPRMLWIAMISPFIRHRMTLLMPPPNMKDYLVDLAGLLEREEIKPVISTRCSLSEVPDAIRLQGEGHATGKTVVTVADAE